MDFQIIKIGPRFVLELTIHGQIFYSQNSWLDKGQAETALAEVKPEAATV